MEPVVEELQREGIAVRRVNVDRETEMAVRFEIRQLPTYVIFTGGKEASRLVGVQSAATIRQAIAESGRVRLTPTDAQTRMTPLTQEVLQPASRGVAVAALSEPMPSQALAAAVERAAAATVRLRVFENVGYGVGTGTVIDRRGNELLVLTCGHLFRDTQGQGKVEVDLFQGGQVHTVLGRVLDFDAKDRDIGLVIVQSELPIVPVPLVTPTSQPRNGDSVFSFGCDRGADPSRRDTRLTGINKYNQHLKLSNLEIAGAPIDGRSGGGLFNSSGELIGVCNAADYDDDIGIYAGPGEIFWQLDRVGLQATMLAATSASGSGMVSPSGLAGAALDTAKPISSNHDPQPAHPKTPGMGDDQEVIVIVRSRSNPAAQARVVTFEQAPPQLMQLLQTPAAR